MVVYMRGSYARPQCNKKGGIDIKAAKVAMQDDSAKHKGKVLIKKKLRFFTLRGPKLKHCQPLQLFHVKDKIKWNRICEIILTSTRKNK